MTDRPILFSAPMVRALLDGRKTQTRRIIEPCKDAETRVGDILVSWPADAFVRQGARFRPRYAKGDRLWVREAWQAPETFDPDTPKQIEAACLDAGYRRPWCPIHWPADNSRSGSAEEWNGEDTGRLRASMHLPRSFSRLTLIVTDVRVQRVQEISEEDAIAEGIERVDYDGPDPQYAGAWGWRDYREDHPHSVVPFNRSKAVRSFQSLWDSLNASRGFGWEEDPWVVALTFRLIKQNIDRIEKEAA